MENIDTVLVCEELNWRWESPIAFVNMVSYDNSFLDKLLF